jgi:hypothetical protein
MMGTWLIIIIIIKYINLNSKQVQMSLQIISVMNTAVFLVKSRDLVEIARRLRRAYLFQLHPVKTAAGSS